MLTLQIGWWILIGWLQKVADIGAPELIEDLQELNEYI